MRVSIKEDKLELYVFIYIVLIASHYHMILLDSLIWILSKYASGRS